MSQIPKPYDRVNPFGSASSNNPSNPIQGTKLDAEFNAIEVSLDQTQARLAEIQRDDGALKNESVGPDQMTPELLAVLAGGFNPRGTWQANTNYAAGDAVNHGEGMYVALRTHRSSLNFDADMSAGDWMLFSQFAAAPAIPITPIPPLTATTVQGALEELNAKDQALNAFDVSLVDLTDPAKGAGVLGRGTVSVSGVKLLLSQPQRTDLKFAVGGYYAGTLLGGGLFFWDAAKLRSTHNGGTIISPTVPWDGTSATVSDFLNGIGETAPTASGCFVRAQERRLTSPEMFGALPSFSTDVTAAFQAAVFAAVNGECVLSAANYRVGPIKVKGFTRVSGPGRGTAVILADNAPDHLFTTNDPAVDTNIELVGFRINGGRATQTLANAAIHLSSTAPVGVTLTRHLVKDIWVTNVKGDGIYMDTACRESLITACNLSDCDGYGIYAAMSDSQVSDCVVGRSGLSGVYVRQGIQLTNVKSWYSGRLDNVGRGFEIRDADNAKLVNCWSQENAGHGFDVYASSGTIKGVQLVGCTADSDNTTNSGKNGFNIVNAEKSRFDVLVRTFTGSAGTPQNGMAVGNATVDCEITLTSQGQISRAIELNAAVGNRVEVNGRKGRVRQFTYAASVSNDPWTQETLRTMLTGPMTVNAPQKNPHGLTLRYIFNQDTTGGRVVTFDPIFVVSWTPNTAANKTNIIEFLCDGTQWIQISTVIGL